MVRTLAALTFVLALLPACGPAKEPETPEGGDANAAKEAAPAETKPAEETPAAEAKPEGETPAAEAKAPERKPAEAKALSESESLAKEIIKGGGRRIGWSASKKLFVVPMEKRTESTGSLDIHFYGEDGQSRDPMRICQPGECEEHLDEKVAEVLPKLAAKLEEGGFVAIRSIGWPDNRDELDVSSLSMKLKWSKGKIEGVKEGEKKAVAFTAVGGKLDISALKAIYIVPDSKLLGVFGTPSKPGFVQTFHVVKMP
ncbi:hypothetical protein [Polyangium mundeleinium]|uniref:Uncharacterized protein n=1 Tax=Polyangium mundeleinium TaxID=2995306 RepID=A0ABT5F1S7_9BACT|nr:hypothetical protein [Polyangium mundeleinium]MDC0748039.1 hypothetical protein [Polyangium mundeleinium]